MNGTLTDVFAAIGLSVTCVAIGFPIGWVLASLWIRLRPQRRPLYQGAGSDPRYPAASEEPCAMTQGSSDVSG